MSYKPPISKSIPNRPLTHRLPVYHKYNFVGYLRLTSQEKGQLTRGHTLAHQVGQSMRLQGMKFEKAIQLINQREFFPTASPIVVIYLLSHALTITGNPKVNLYTNRQLKDFPWSQRLLLKDEIREGEWE